MTHVLLVGSETPVFADVAAALEGAGATVARAGDVPAALERLEAGGVDCVVSVSPAVDGRRLRRELWRRGHAVPLVAFGDADDPPVAGPGVDPVVTDDPAEAAERIYDVATSHRVEVQLDRRRRRRAALDGVAGTLFGRTTRDDIEETLCATLVDSEAYHTAWVGEYDQEASVVVPRAAAGIDRTHLATVPTDASADGSVTKRAATEHVVAANASDGYVSVAVPLVHEGSLLGVLHAYGRRSDGLDEVERSRLADLGREVAAAVADAETGIESREEAAAAEPVEDPLGDFGSVLYHELTNQLEAAELQLELARESGDEGHLDRADEAFERIATLAADARALAHGELDTGERPLSDAARAAWETTETADAGLEIYGNATVEADGDLLELLLANLFRNAVEHAGADVTVRVGELDDGFYVEDDGSGIPSEERDAVFEWGRSTDGSGIGLGIVARIAERHGWDVDVAESDAGGARFEFTRGQSPST